MDLHLEGKVAIVTGGGGAICGEIARALCREGAIVAIWDLLLEKAERKSAEISSSDGICKPFQCDVTDRNSVRSALEETLKEFGKIEILINGAGGSKREATTSPELEFFDIKPSDLIQTINLNYLSAVIPSQEVGRIFADNEYGVILNISSIAGVIPISRAVGYSSGKSALNNFTRWLAVHMALNYSSAIRVNAIAPGFILTEQNRFLLVDENTGNYTERARNIINFVPVKRLGKPEEVVPVALLLVSDISSFITGSVFIVDGGFTARSGV